LLLVSLALGFESNADLPVALSLLVPPDCFQYCVLIL